MLGSWKILVLDPGESVLLHNVGARRVRTAQPCRSTFFRLFWGLATSLSLSLSLFQGCFLVLHGLFVTINQDEGVEKEREGGFSGRG